MKVILELECNNTDQLLIKFNKDHTKTESITLKSIKIDDKEFATAPLTDYIVDKSSHPEFDAVLHGNNHLGLSGIMFIEIGDSEFIEYKLMDPENQYIKEDYEYYKKTLEYVRKKRNI